MMEDLKTKVKKLMYNLYFLGTFVFFLCLFTLITPYLMQQWGPSWLGKTLGPKVMKDTLDLIFSFLSLSFIFFLGISFYYLFKIFKHMERIEEALVESGRKSYSLGQKIGEKGQRFFSFWSKQNQLLKYFLDDQEKDRTILQHHKDKLENYLQLTRQSHQTLEREIEREKNKAGKISEANEVNLGKAIEETMFPEVKNLLVKMQDILFQTQVLAFNTGVEINRGNDLERDFAPLIRELENLLQRGGGIAEKMEKSLKEESEQILGQWTQAEKNWGNHLAEKEQVLHRVTSSFQEVLEKSSNLEKTLNEVKMLLNNDQTAPFLHWREWEEENGRLTEVLVEIGQDLKILGHKMGLSDREDHLPGNVVNVLEYHSSTDGVPEFLPQN